MREGRVSFASETNAYERKRILITKWGGGGARLKTEEDIAETQCCLSAIRPSVRLCFHFNFITLFFGKYFEGECTVMSWKSVMWMRLYLCVYGNYLYYTIIYILIRDGYPFDTFPAHLHPQIHMPTSSLSSYLAASAKSGVTLFWQIVTLRRIVTLGDSLNSTWFNETKAEKAEKFVSKTPIGRLVEEAASTAFMSWWCFGGGG